MTQYDDEDDNDDGNDDGNNYGRDYGTRMMAPKNMTLPLCVCVCDLTDQANDDRSPYFHKNRGTNVNSTFIEDRVHTIVFPHLQLSIISYQLF